MRKESKSIEIKEEVRIPGTDIILEAGDKIEVLKEGLKWTSPDSKGYISLEVTMPDGKLAWPVMISERVIRELDGTTLRRIRDFIALKL